MKAFAAILVMAILLPAFILFLEYAVKPIILDDAAMSRQAAWIPQPQDRTRSVSTYSKYGHTLTTVEHDGHWFVVGSRDNSLLHHPGCPCLKPAEATP